MKSIVVMLGRPNVGKSTLFNRLTRSRDALVDNIPGVTRDRHYGNVAWQESVFTLVDTGGFVSGDDDRFAGKIRFQVQQAVADADIILLMFDGRAGLSPYDRDLVQLVRPLKKPIFYAVNKIDAPEQEEKLFEFYGLGLESLYPLSAEHGYGVSDLLSGITTVLPRENPPEAPASVRLAVVGRPNVGKSSLINCVLGEQRLLVSDMPGTTRDAVDSLCHIDGQAYLLIDTAGIRRKGRVSQKIEKFSIVKALRSLDRCDVALIVIDAAEGIREQDITVAGYAFERGCGCILLLNKWDLVEKDTHTAQQYLERLRTEAKFLSFAPVLTISALTGQRIFKIFRLAREVYEQYSTRIATGPLNRVLSSAISRHEPPFYRGRRLKFYYASQVTVSPPTVVCFVNYPEAVHFSYRRYLLNQIRAGTGLDRTPLRLVFRKRTGRAQRKKRR